MMSWVIAASGLMVAFNTAVLLLAIAGFMAILRALLDSQALRANLPRKWTWLVLWAWMMWLGAAGVLWYGLGYRGPRILSTGSWADMPTYGWVLILLGVAAAVTSLFFWFRKLMHDDPKALVSRVPRALPIHPDLRKPKDGQEGFSDLLAKLPGNQLFDVNIVEEQVRLPRLPSQWEGLSVLHISDLHMAYTPNRPYFEKVMQFAQELRPDIIALTGDIVDKDARLRWIPNVLGRLKAPLGKYYILGDHDYAVGDEKVRDVMEMTGWIDVGHRFIVAPVRGRELLIMGTQRPWTKKHTLAPMGTTVHFSIALSHYPHHLEWASNRHFDLLLTGHPTGGALNLPWPGLIGPSAYAPGLHYRAPTLMNASHGLSRSWSMTFTGQPGMTLLVLHGPNPADRPAEPLTLDGPIKEGSEGRSLSSDPDTARQQPSFDDEFGDKEFKRPGWQPHKRTELTEDDD